MALASFSLSGLHSPTSAVWHLAFFCDSEAVLGLTMPHDEGTGPKEYSRGTSISSLKHSICTLSTKCALRAEVGQTLGFALPFVAHVTCEECDNMLGLPWNITIWHLDIIGVSISANMFLFANGNKCT